MSEHTAGPWEIGQYPWLIQAVQQDGVDGEIAQANSHRPDYQANVRLIAAAPCLLALARAVVAYSETSGNCAICTGADEDDEDSSHYPDCPVPAARAAIMKATGGE